LSRILVVRVGALGDTLMVTPAVRALRRQNPEAEIDFLCAGPAGSLLEANPNITRILRLHGRNLPYAISLEKRRLVGELRSRDYDLALLLESAPRYRELLTRAEIRTIRGFEQVPFDRSRHCIVNYGPRKKKKDQSLRLKGWDRAGWARLIPKLLDLGAGILMTGSAEDRADVQSIAQGLPRDRVRLLAGGTSVRELAAIIRNLDLFISVDTGPAHMAAALGTPLVVLWGPAIHEQTRPLSSFSPIEIVRASVPCAPCYDTPAMKTCRDNLCMKGISPDAVFSAALRIGIGPR
jgi:ADP-heptose:LPS heptosyltransferase